MEIKLLNHGFVRLVDKMGDDASIVQAARVSYGKGTKSVSEDRALIRYLMRHRHTSVFEQAVIKIHVKCPIFVARQWLRHRTWSFNELSLRYSEAKDEMFLPELDTIKEQSKINKQGTGDLLNKSDLSFVQNSIGTSCDSAINDYQSLVKYGVAREMARVVLPVAAYTEFYATVDAHNLMHFLSLRMKPAAQYEIRVYADALFKMLQDWLPDTAEAFLDYVLNGYNLSATEIGALNAIIRHLSNDPSLGSFGALMAGYKDFMGKNELASFNKFLKGIGYETDI